MNSIKTKLTHKVLFTVRSGSNGWVTNVVESDRIAESSLEEWAKDAYRHHIGKQMSNRDWEIFKTNRRLVSKTGNLLHEFEFDRYTIEG